MERTHDRRLGGALRPAVCLVLALVLGIVSGSGIHVRRAGADTFQPRLVVSDIGTLPASFVSIQNIGLAASHIQVDQYRNDGSLDRTVSPGGQSFDNILPGASTFAAVIGGPATISSDQPVAAVILRAAAGPDGQGDVQASVGVGNPVPYAGSTAGSTVSLPYVANHLGSPADGLYDTTLFVVNAGPALACVQVNYAFVTAGKAAFLDKGPGGGGCATGYPIPVHGQITMSADAQPGGFAMPPATQGAQMAATVTSTGSPIGVSVLATELVGGGLLNQTVYTGFLASGPSALGPVGVGTSLLVPVALKTPDGYFSEILLSNSGDLPADAAIVYTGSVGGTKGPYTVHIPVPPHGVNLHSVYSDNVVPVGFTGTATVTSTQPVAAVVFRQKMTTAGSGVYEDVYTAVDALSATSAGKRVNVPFIARRFGAVNGHDGVNTWVSVAVPGGGPANLTLRTVFAGSDLPVCNGEGVYQVKLTITDSRLFYQNADIDSGLGTKPPDCALLGGGMVITSDVPIVAVAGFSVDTEAGGVDGMFNVATQP